MNQVPYCYWHEPRPAVGPHPLTPVAWNGANSGPGWSYFACQDCMISCRLIPSAWHPADTWGEAIHWPEILPAVVVPRLAQLAALPDDERPDLRPAVERLLDAAATIKSPAASADARAAANEDARAAVAELRGASRRGLHAVP